MINAETYVHRPVSPVIVHNLFSAFMIYLQEVINADDDTTCVDQVMRRLVDGLAVADFRVSDALAGIDMSADHLRRLFTRHIGVSPKQFLTNLRINHAGTLIQTGMSVAAAAATVGMPDPYHFSRLFRKTMGTSPSAFRKSSVTRPLTTVPVGKLS